MAPKKDNSSIDSEFVQEYLYIEDYYPIPKSENQQEEEEDIDRGVIIIDLF